MDQRSSDKRLPGIVEICAAIIAGNPGTATSQLGSILNYKAAAGTSVLEQLVTAAGYRVAQEFSSHAIHAIGAHAIGFLVTACGMAGLSELRALSAQSVASPVVDYVTAAASSRPIFRLGIPALGFGAAAFGATALLRSSLSPTVKIGGVLVAGLVAIRSGWSLFNRSHMMQIHTDNQSVFLEDILDEKNARISTDELLSDIRRKRFFTRDGRVCTNGTLVLNGHASRELKLKFLRAVATETQTPLLVVSMPELCACAQGSWLDKNLNFLKKYIKECSGAAQRVIVCFDQFECVSARMHTLLIEGLFSWARDNEQSHYDGTRVLFAALVSPGKSIDQYILKSAYFNNDLLVEESAGAKLSVSSRAMFERVLRHAVEAPRSNQIWSFGQVQINNSFDALVGLSPQIGVLRHAIQSRLQNKSADPIGGVILSGPAGTGKSTIGLLLASTYHLPCCNATAFFKAAHEMSKSEFSEQLTRLLLSAYTTASAECRPVVIYVDDADHLLADLDIAVKHGLSASIGESCLQKLRFVQDTLRTVLDSSDLRSFIENNIIFVVSTNTPIEELDERLTRHGRFNWKISCPLPDESARKQFIDLYLAQEHKTLDQNTVCQILSQTKQKSIPTVRQALSEALIHADKCYQPQRPQP